MFDYPAESTAPNCCFICERTPLEGEHFAAPGFVFEPDFPHKLYGTKMVCDNCIDALAQHKGYTTLWDFNESLARDQATIQAITQERDELQAKLDGGVAELVKLFNSQKVSQSRNPARKPATRKTASLEH